MELFAIILGGLLVGFLGGYGLARIERRRTCVGTLRVDSSDPDERPYLFLELEPGGLDRIRAQKIVRFRVNLESYLPRK